MSSKHSRQPSFAPMGAFRWTMTILGGWSLIATAFDSAPRYQRVVEFVLAIIIVFGFVALMRRVLASEAQERAARRAVR